MAIFQDEFTEAANVALSAHTPTTSGTSWDYIWSTSGAEGTDGWTVVASTDRVNPRTANSAGAIYTATGTYPTANYSVQCDMVSLATTTDDPIFLLVRVQDQENMYAVKINDQGGTNTCQLYKKVSGTWSTLGSAFNPPADGSVIKLEINGSSLKFYDDGVEVASATDSDITATGKAGIASGGGTEMIVSTEDNNNGNILDNFVVTDLGAGGTVVKDMIGFGLGIPFAR